MLTPEGVSQRTSESHAGECPKWAFSLPIRDAALAASWRIACTNCFILFLLFWLTHQNWRRNLMSFSYKRRISSISYFNRAIRSNPIPKAKPVYLSGSILLIRSTLGCTIPQPRISIQPEPLQKRQPFPPHLKQLTSISALGSVKLK